MGLSLIISILCNVNQEEEECQNGFINIKISCKRHDSICYNIIPLFFMTFITITIFGFSIKMINVRFRKFVVPRQTRNTK